ncbi:MAG: protein-tyrosine-phosphatase [Planctomycetota bacterium]
MKAALLACILCMVSAVPTPEVAALNHEPVSSRLTEYVQQRIAEFDQIDDARRAELEAFARYVSSAAESADPVRLNFVCTHNSRRSHMAMIWAAVAASHYRLESVATFSGGTENTAFNPRAVAAIERAGLGVEAATPAPNPIYLVRYDGEASPLICFSKAYDQPPNPAAGFAAVMVCADADENCPVVFGADARFAIRYVDPKVSDDTDLEAATYDERCAQISREMLYAFSMVR